MNAASLLMPTRVLIVGGGGREHALAWKLGAEPGVNEVIVTPGSGAIARVPRVRCLAVDPLDPEAVVALARQVSAELVVVGPEAPLAAGVADALTAAGIAVFGPSAAAARIETSKAFCHEVAAAAGVRMARAATFVALAPALAFARELASTGDGVVIKADGLAAGKGVTVCDGPDDGREALETAFAGLDARVVVEERLRGPEASLIALVDGGAALALPLARDHKRLLDHDEGPNTGGMGAYSPLPDLPADDVPALVAAFHRPILAELARRGTPFRGALYAGLMLTDDGPVLLECNARFGDPETQVLLPRLAVSLGPLLLAAARGELAGAARALGLDDVRLPVVPGATVGIVLASAGYPDAPRHGDEVHGLDAAEVQGAVVFHAGTTIGPDGVTRTAGGRVLTVVGRGPDLEAARVRAEAAADSITFDGVLRRHDIGRAPVAAGASGSSR
jgi:phosphoribosylamine---glycine ligase